MSTARIVGQVGWNLEFLFVLGLSLVSQVWVEIRSLRGECWTERFELDPVDASSVPLVLTVWGGNPMGCYSLHCLAKEA